MHSAPPHWPPLHLIVLSPSVRRPPRWRARLVVALLLVPLLGVIAAGGRMLPLLRGVRGMQRLPVAMDTLRAVASPAVTRTRAVTFLLVGSDEPRPATEPAWPKGRSDAVLLARLAADRRSLSVVSIPRDAWVEVPGHGEAKLNAAYAWGGPGLLVRTLQQLTGLGVDHVVAVDLAGLASLVDSLGGVTVVVAESTQTGDARLAAGANSLDGAAAARYVRQRRGLPEGDLDRVRRHQELLRAALGRTAGQGLAARLLGGSGPLQPWLSCVQVDESLSPAELARWWGEIQAAGPLETRFLTAPVRGTGTQAGQSVVWLDRERGALLWRHLAADSLVEIPAELAACRLPEAPR